jgi:hypothetical protein
VPQKRERIARERIDDIVSSGEYMRAWKPTNPVPYRTWYASRRAVIIVQLDDEHDEHRLIAAMAIVKAGAREPDRRLCERAAHIVRAEQAEREREAAAWARQWKRTPHDAN